MILTKLRQSKVNLLTIALITISGIQSFSQQTAPRPSVDKGSIEDRFNYILREGVTVDDSKTIKSWWLYHLKTYVLDTVKSLHNEIELLQGSVSSKSSNYDSLGNELKQLTEKLEVTIKEKNSISLLGFQMNKSAYNLLLWAIIGGLAFLLIIFILMFKRSNLVTVQTKKGADELRIEFDSFRKRAREREEELVRKHHNEIQKYKNSK